MSRMPSNSRPLAWRLARTGSLAVAAALVAGCMTWSNGLSPIQPEHDAVVLQDTPLLQWQASDAKAEEVLYDVAVFDSIGNVVYQARGLAETSHTVATPLGPGRYRWRVRPMIRRDGRWIEGEWNGRREFLFAGVFASWGSGSYAFKVEGRPL